MVLAVCVMGVLLWGCVTEGRPGEGPRAAPTTDEMTPGKMTLLAVNFQDTDDNGYRDSANVVVYLFSQSANYRLSIPAEGTFTFRLMDRQGPRLAEWSFDRAATAAALRRQMAPGAGYMFTLNLNEVGTDQIVLRDAELTCTFMPTGADGKATGDVLRSRSKPLLIGPMSQDPGGVAPARERGE